MESGSQAARVAAGEVRALARLITGLENGDPAANEVMRALSSRPRKAQVIGITGPPGSGKSTLADKLILELRRRGARVGVLAVDPSSPYTGGAILGDRLRMQDHATDDGVYIRSLASRGHLGGISRATHSAARALDAAGYDFVIIETVGVGQSEVDVVRVADTVVLVSVPGLGDEIQVIKAGVMEIGDVFVVNKCDRDGADRVVREIRTMLETAQALRRGALPVRASVDTLAGRGGVTDIGFLHGAGHHGAAGFQSSPAAGAQGAATAAAPGAAPGGAEAGEPFDLEAHLKLGPAGDPASRPASRIPPQEEFALPPVMKTIAETGEGVPALVDAILEHHRRAEASGLLEARRLEGARTELRALVEERLDSRLAEGKGAERSRALAKAVAAGELDAWTASGELLGLLIQGGIQ